ncbi:MAG: NAD(P)-dependent glycerol-3-phosphate dehydrogenase [Lachnospiraceae bacterium]|nr:NAD(P)-dependent glycerol-3-phosphate dehydrogenase [Lachnospiraceae bacterium]MBP3755351.1 NAD(P)-dependent glycerol-3-phosphate dehydrogenase [Lachnospiraceae bacterium]
MAKISVLGGGTWAIGLTIQLASAGHDVTVWSALDSEIEMLSSTHAHKNLPGATIPDSVKYTLDDKEAVTDKDILVMAVASSFTRKTAKRLAPLVKEGQIIVDVAKGIEEGTLKTLSEQILDEIPTAKVCALSGPTHAEEVSRYMPTTIVASSPDKEVAMYIQDVFMTDTLRVYTSSDIKGVELGGSLKNVVALAAGIADGLGYGDNAKAALITRGIAEISRLGVKMGCRPETFSGLTGMGDLIVTCASMHSRNRRCGILLGQGKSLEEAQKEVGMVVEGIYSAKAAIELGKKYDVSLPIIEQVNLILFEGKDAGTAVKELMLREKKDEVSDTQW